MMIALSLLLFGGAAGLALWATKHDEDLIWVGGAILFSFLVSNVLWFAGGITHRPGVYTMLEMFILIAAFLSWHEKRHRALIGVAVLATLSIAANVAFALVYSGEASQVRAHETATNIIFMFECLLTIGVGIMDGHRSGRFDRGINNGGPSADPHVGATGGSD